MLCFVLNVSFLKLFLVYITCRSTCFRNCDQFTDIDELHRTEMEKAAKEARRLYTREHPEAATIQLKHDPLKHIQGKILSFAISTLSCKLFLFFCDQSQLHFESNIFFFFHKNNTKTMDCYWQDNLWHRKSDLILAWSLKGYFT